MVNSFVQWMMGALLAVIHPFFVSMTDIKHNAAEQSVEVSVRIFTDDLEQTIKKNCACKIDLIKPADKAKADQLIAGYVTKHLSLVADGKTLALSYVGYEIQEGSVWSYYEVKKITAVKQLQITNSLLHDYKDQQVNMIQVNANGYRKIVKLDFPNTKTAVSF
jgi:hypothetical protein